MSKIIVNADDYGMTPEISVAILKAAKSRAINSTSVDVCNQITQKDAEVLSDMGISIGLHLNLTEGRPVGDGEGIADLLDGSGSFKTANRNLEFNVNSKSIYFELKHQLNRFRFYFGCDPNHIDSHQHFIYLHPLAFEATLQLAKDTKIPMRSPKPFIHAETLRWFCERVKDRYGVVVPFIPEERASVLKNLFYRYNPKLRSDSLYLDFDPTISKENCPQTGCVEMIVHPNL